MGDSWDDPWSQLPTLEYHLPYFRLAPGANFRVCARLLDALGRLDLPEQA